ncbi:MAG: hypothetical protein DI628_06635 [Blastochloris viridis]|uniref:Carbamoyltransferase n=1 Tax=Blastochloris viridis TaxID=1079 RepID=A0A6N4R8K9_BLAVI|nr:MAG: hypothetical protein DI628_06635 [Blastochloris viridis]
MSKAPVYILGISGLYQSSAAALLKDGVIVAAAQEERFTRIRYDSDFPHSSIAWCLAQAGITLEDVTHVAFYDKPLLKFTRLLQTYKAIAPVGLRSFLKSTEDWLAEKFLQRQKLIKELQHHHSSSTSAKILFAQHHLSHAASAFYPSPYSKAVVLVIDGLGELATTTVAIGSQEKLEIIREIAYPHSLGLLYSAFTAYIGYKPNGDEYKLMGLAAYGEPSYDELIRGHLIHVKPDGSFRLNMDYFDFTAEETLTNSRFHKLFGGAPRRRGTTPTQREMDLAASIQKVIEDVILRMTRALAAEFPDIPNLCLAGELAYNRPSNSRISADPQGFKNVWIQPAADDSGGAIGAAYCAWHQHMGMPLPAKDGITDAMHAGYLGPSFTNRQVERALDTLRAVYRPIKTEDELLDHTAEALAQGKVVGWFQGRMEFGDRALGNRSILGDPRNPDTQRNMGIKTRFTQSLRPSAASIARERLAEWFETDIPSPYMLLVAPLRKKHLKKNQTMPDGSIIRSQLPAITHADNTARLHTVQAESNRRFHALLKEFELLTQCPILANTPLARAGQPIVNTPEEAFHLFMSTDLDMLVIENNILYKEEQNPALLPHYQTHLNRR